MSRLARFTAVIYDKKGEPTTFVFQPIPTGATYMKVASEGNVTLGTYGGILYKFGLRSRHITATQPDREVLTCMVRLGIITPKQKKDHLDWWRERNMPREHRENVDELLGVAKRLGLELTDDQKKKLNIEGLVLI